MEEEGSSWVRRAKFSHTVCYRVNSSRLPAIPLSNQADRNLESKMKTSSLDFPRLAPDSSTADRGMGPNQMGSIRHSYSMPSFPLPSQPASTRGSTSLRRSSLENSSFSFHPDQESKWEPKRLNSQSSNSSDQDPKLKRKGSNSCNVSDSLMRFPLDSVPHESGSLLNRNEWRSKPKQRSLSPLPATSLSDAFKEGRASGKRFSTPPPSRRGSDTSVFGKLFSREARDHQSLKSKSPPLSPLSSMKALENLKSKKETPWARYFDHGGGRVNAVETTDEWMVDLSQLYLGLRFASGAHSRLYHGIYKDQPVAVKIIRQPDDDENGVMAARLEKQFTREVTLLSHLHHRNVIKLAAACKNPPVFCVIVEYLSGGSLRAFLHKLEHRSLPLQKLIAIALDIARGMEYIHSQGVIHRDLKPENIIFDEDMCVKIADFGIACEEAYCDALAEDAGTFRWMAPEMIKHKHYGRKVDVYSFGLLLWEMLTGRIPYEDMTPIQAAFAVVDKNLRPVIPPDCPAALRALIEQCWALHPEKRPEFWQIVKVLEQFESVLARDGTLDMVPNLTCQDHKKRLLHWIQKLKPSLADGSGQLAPKLL